MEKEQNIKKYKALVRTYEKKRGKEIPGLSEVSRFHHLIAMQSQITKSKPCSYKINMIIQESRGLQFGC